MRVIAGQFKGRNLKSPPSMDVRPTSDRLRETLFNVIAGRVPGARFLDLCAGTGAVGIEALSRGAAHATFVDRSRRSCQLIEANLELCKVPEEQRDIYCSEVIEFVKQSGDHEWDIIFLDPPYNMNYLRIVDLLASSTILSDSGLLIVEHHHKTKLPESIGNLRRTRVLKQGDSSLSFYVC
ncbi:MAG TPA: 16S rRNA (guanine(966)-N(2))-methyltransferase RsmD [Pyrinomonadaceae bacterium]|nr:16S rRNA (guanine(966)-N(2))-methyltransferase RsmD [Pyrinomonadaceae bacterium]